MKNILCATLVAIALSASLHAQQTACEQQREQALQLAEDNYRTCASNFDWYDSIWNWFFGGNSCEQQHSADINYALDAFRRCIGDG